MALKISYRAVYYLHKAMRRLGGGIIRHIRRQRKYYFVTRPLQCTDQSCPLLHLATNKAIFSRLLSKGRPPGTNGRHSGLQGALPCSRVSLPNVSKQLTCKVVGAHYPPGFSYALKTGAPDPGKIIFESNIFLNQR